MTVFHKATAVMAARASMVRLATLTLIVSACVTAPLLAQRMPDIKGPIKAAEKAADATNARLSAQTGQDVPVRRGTSAAPAPAKSSGPGSTPATTGAATNGPSTTAPSIMAPVTREIFTYADEGRRDPFFSLILTEDLRPLLSDLKLVGVLYEASGRSVAIMRDVQTNAQYRVNAGQTLGRMRVAQIKPRVVIFTIDEFGLSRQDSLFLVDSTKVRIK
ncbi:MAG: hypothetical protein M3Z05_16645 [Gemmatimonadota bacterium]|nr:hypothetical protein [Gemmatimonadota bacterium]